MRFEPVRVNDVPLDRANAADRARLAEVKAAVIRLRNFGAALSTIGDKLGMTEDDVERVLGEGLRELVADDAAEVRAKQQAVLNDMKRALYPGLAQGDQGAMGVMLRTLDHELKITPGAAAPQRVAVGMDAEAFETRVDEDMRALGIHPRMDTPLEPDDGTWANT